MSSRSLNWLKFGGLVALAFALGLLFAGLLDLPSRSSAQEAQVASAIPAVPAPSIPAAKPLLDLSDAFSAVADHVRPSVVYIRSQHTERPNQKRLPPGMERFRIPTSRCSRSTPRACLRSRWATATTRGSAAGSWRSVIRWEKA